MTGISAGSQVAFASSHGTSASSSSDHVAVCGLTARGDARCGAIQLLDPSQNWHPGPKAIQPSRKPGSPSTTSSPSGYYPGDLQSAYGLQSALANMTTPGGATVAIVDAYDDPYAASNLANYRTTMNSAIDPATNLQGSKIPPLCSSTVTSGCVHFTKVNQTGGTSYPTANSSWSEEISLDLDMVSAICPDCNIVLVEASSSSFSNLAAAVAYAKSLHPAVVTNSYGGSEFNTETSDNGTYSYSTSGGNTAITAATGDSGYGVEFPAASPDLTAVGGTTLTYTGTGSSLTWNPQSVWSGAGAGCSTYEPIPTWQNTSAYDLSSVCGNRQVGDISAVADPNTGVAVYDTYGVSGWLVFGGTSASTQIVGAMYGLAAGAGNEQPSPANIYNGSGITAVTTGSDGSCGGTYLCQAGTGAPSSGYAGPVGVGVPSGIGAFSTSTAGSLTFSPSSESTVAGQVVGPLTVNLSSAAPSTGVTINLSSTSGGSFSSSPTGSFTPTLQVSVGSNSSVSSSFYFEDTVAGSATVTASALGWNSAALPVTVGPGALATISLTPASATVAEGNTQVFSATGADAYGNVVSINPQWSTSISTSSVSPTNGSSTTFTAGSTAATGVVTATVGGVSDSASVTVTALTPMSLSVTNASTTRKGPNYLTPLTATATTTGAVPVSGASATVSVYSGACSTGTLVSTSSGTTASNGQFSFTFSSKKQGSYCALATASKGGYTSATGQDSITI